MDLFGLARPLLMALNPEQAHKMTLMALKAGLAPRQKGADDPRLAVRLWGHNFPNPVGLAAGFDKNAEVFAPMLGLGFGFVEIGSLTPRPQPGNPLPRLFRLPRDGAVINRLGFNNQGVEDAYGRLEKRLATAEGRDGLVGVNLGKNKDSEDAATDYGIGSDRLSAFADYLVVNVSSPNTPGLRALQSVSELNAIIDAVITNRKEGPKGGLPPILVKIAPDLGDEDRADLAAFAKERVEQGVIGGIIISNTTLARPETLIEKTVVSEAGGLSGKPLFQPSTEMLSEFYRETAGTVPLIGVGGIASGADAYAKIRAGASLVQLYSALIYQGPGLVGRIKQVMLALMRQDGFTRITTAIGADHN